VVKVLPFPICIYLRASAANGFEVFNLGNFWQSWQFWQSVLIRAHPRLSAVNFPAFPITRCPDHPILLVAWRFNY
jgi:hypothetical protein